VNVNKCLIVLMYLPVDPIHMYPFSYRPMYPIVEDGWTAFRPETEYSKLLAALPEEWRLSHVNKDYSVSLTRNSGFAKPISAPIYVIE